MVITSRFFGSGDQLLVMEAPPGCGIHAEALALVLRVGARPRRHVDDAHFEHVALFRALHVNRPGAYMYTEAFARTASEQAGVHRPGTAADDALLLLVPVEDAFGTRITPDHAVEVVAGMMGERFDGDEVTRLDRHLRLQRLAEIAPVHGVGAGGDVIVIDRLHRAGRVLRHGGADPAGTERAETGGKRTLEQAAA
jgi:hypothetical protein